MDYEPKWNVKPTDTLSGSIGAHAHWEAVRVTGGVVTHEIQMAKYACRIWTTGDLRRSGGGGWAPPVMIGPFSVLHRPDDGDVGLAAKVLAMAAVQPGWDSYKAYVKEWASGNSSTLHLENDKCADPNHCGGPCIPSGYVSVREEE
jgi:hypothetical protein